MRLELRLQSLLTHVCILFAISKESAHSFWRYFMIFNTVMVRVLEVHDPTYLDDTFLENFYLNSVKPLQGTNYFYCITYYIN